MALEARARRDGEKIGKLEDVYVDVETDEPMFGTIKEGFIGRHLTFVPLGGVMLGPDNLQMTVSRELVKAAPKIELHGEELSQATSRRSTTTTSSTTRRRRPRAAGDSRVVNRRQGLANRQPRGALGLLPALPRPMRASMRLVVLALVSVIACVGASTGAAHVIYELGPVVRPAVKPPPPPPPSPPPVPTASPWRLPMAFVSDGFRAGVFSDAGVVARRLQRAGMRLRRLEIGQVTPGEARASPRPASPSTSGASPTTATIARRWRRSATSCAGYIIQIEDEAQYHSAVANLEGGVGKNLPERS